MTNKNHQVDLLVIGSGAGALTCAVTAALQGLKVLVVEKSDKYGGTSAMSGGGIWIPNNSNARNLGGDDSFEQSYRYMKSVIGDEVDEQRIKEYINKAPQMIDYLQNNTHFNYEAYPYPDYYSDQPGAKQGYRTQAPKVFDGAKLGAALYQMRPQPSGSLVQGRYTLTFNEARKFLIQDKGWRWTLLKILLVYYADIKGRLKGKMSRRLTQGHALVGSLYASLMEAGGDLWLNAPMLELITLPATNPASHPVPHTASDNNSVVGAIIEHNGERIEVSASAVVLAAGGFEHNQSMRDNWLPAPTQCEWSVSQHNNTGDAIQAAGKVDAAVDLMQQAWWIPVVNVPGWDRSQGIFAERSLPGLVIVNQQGQRFANEALPYLESGYAIYESGSIPVWVIFDARFRHKYPFGPLPPGWASPDKRLSKKVKSILVKADSIESLAQQLNMDYSGLASTISRNNNYAESGIDKDFSRGKSYYDRYYGDYKNQPNPCIAKIETAPFYALPLYPGDIGTKGGLVTNVNAQVINNQGVIIEGLYATGNCSASVMGSKYLGAGATLGPAMTFGYIAALHIAQQLKQKTVDA